MDPLQGNEAIQQFMKLLEENGRQGQAADLSALMWYMDGMNRQFDAVFQELREVKAQLTQEKQPAVRRIMKGVVTKLENRVDWARKMLTILRERIVDCSRNAVENFKEAGVSVLDNAMAGMGVKPRLESLQEHISGMISDTKQNIKKVENIGHELRSVGGHLKNAGRALTGKEARTVDGGQEGRFQSVVLAPMRATQELLSNMNNATLAAIGRVESLELSAETARETRAERKAERKPSILRDLAEKKVEIAGKSAPAPEKDHKPPEAAL